jgi:DNA-binding NarL/FixJ family response regulator
MVNTTARETQKSAVLIVDDHPVVRRGLARLINEQSDLAVCAEAENPGDAIVAAEHSKPDVAVVDLSYEGLSGVELVKDLKARLPRLPVLVLSMHDETFYAERVLRAGANGYVMKQESPEKIVDAIRRVLGGHIYLSQTMCSKLLNMVFERGAQTTRSPVEGLSDRELEVLEMIGKGLTTQQIARRLHRSVKTIESHRAHIKAKLKLKNSRDLAHHAVRWVEFNQTAAP